MPVACGVLVEVAPFPASLGAEKLVAAERARLLAELAKLADCSGKLVFCHLRDPLRCRLAVRSVAGRVCWPSWRWSRQWDAVALTAYADAAYADAAPASTAAVTSRAQPQERVTPAPPWP